MPLKKTGRVRMTLRLHEELASRVKQAAAKDTRNVNDEIAVLLEEALSRREEAAP
jgi:hypothetical protein